MARPYEADEATPGGTAGPTSRALDEDQLVAVTQAGEIFALAAQELGA